MNLIQLGPTPMNNASNASNVANVALRWIPWLVAALPPRWMRWIDRRSCDAWYMRWHRWHHPRRWEDGWKIEYEFHEFYGILWNLLELFVNLWLAKNQTVSLHIFDVFCGTILKFIFSITANWQVGWTKHWSWGCDGNLNLPRGSERFLGKIWRSLANDATLPPASPIRRGDLVQVWEALHADGGFCERTAGEVAEVWQRRVGGDGI